jgi:hypothetical protein
MEAVRSPFQGHNPLVQALALHYHFAAMHPFLDGNGRTARAVEALMLQRAGLRNSLFIAMSNYYYDEKNSYLAALAEVRKRDHDLTSFLVFGLKGIAVQCDRLSSEIRVNLSKALFRNTMYDLFNRLKSDKKRVLAQRQIEILKLLLDNDSMDFSQLSDDILRHYLPLKNFNKAIFRDLAQLFSLGAIEWEERKIDGKDSRRIKLRLQWPTEITETAFFEKVKKFPKAKTYPIFQ